MTVKITPALEDYLESILIIQERGNVPRVKDIARMINVKAPSVIEALSHLQKKGLVVHERYGYIEMTSKGLKKAKKLYGRHLLLKKFFQDVLGLDKKLAEEDACRIEHYLSQETLNRMLSFINFIEDHPEEKPDWLSDFQSLIEGNHKG
ncbi:MAG: metal-dependent transcriptional regulator [Candidatus Aureabacteria bacterium]|nr:metal-dependent transcriptional regulator [Candidatus Auribacterota bacterium]